MENIATESFGLTFLEYLKATLIAVRRLRFIYYLINVGIGFQLFLAFIPEDEYTGNKTQELINTIESIFVLNIIVWGLLIILTFLGMPKKAKRLRHVIMNDDFVTTYLQDGTIDKRSISDFIKVRKTKSMYLLLLNSSIGIPITFRAFKTVNDRAEFENIIKARMLKMT